MLGELLTTYFVTKCTQSKNGKCKYILYIYYMYSKYTQESLKNIYTRNLGNKSHKNVKWSCYRPGVAQKLDRGIALLFHDRGTRRGEWSAARPGRTLPPGKTRYPFYRRLVGPQGLSGQKENLVRPGIRSRTVQPVVSLYTDWATRSTFTQGKVQ